ncbi:MAG: type II secretion system F family protein [Nitrospinaceae bacterium]|nr:type II secretion system F family protein [Nitrospinaceae bacterium]NIR57147.1 type II secretion system F family protein [Nitrospinaceae bacterium]NIS87589.1 type II secretion system F family protein [Nitrospinaceae bacterium]NIT84458.1 type II secretion system F family protein [Nitrospinaceae bacterium]NIU46646.1 type II secretion system F family protein [Nitrospinaceae bacterium]
MAKFEYKARDRQGALVMGVMEAASAKAVSSELGRLGHFPVSIETATRPAPAVTEPFMDRFARVKARDLILFSRQMATLFNAGIPLMGILNSIGEQLENPLMKRTVGQLRKDIGEGRSLSEAMAKHPKVFPEMYVSMVQAGEMGGVMDEILHRLADLLENQEENQAKIKAAVRYPKIMLVVMAVAIIILMSFPVPIFIKLYQSMKVPLPLPTRWLIAGYDFILHYWFVPLLAAAGLAAGFKKYTHTPSGRMEWDRFKLQIPLIGPLQLRSAMARFTRIFGSMVRSGVPILEAITVSSRVVENSVISKVIRELRYSVEEGSGLAIPLKQSGWVPTLVVQMVGSGEESGTLDEMLLKVSDYYDQEVDRAIKTMATMIEPILLVVMACLVLFLALAIFLPMWDMTLMVKR